MHIYDALGLRGGNPRFATRGWMTTCVVLFGAMTIFAAVSTVQAAIRQNSWELLFYAFSTALSAVLVTFAAGELRRLRAGTGPTD